MEEAWNAAPPGGCKRRMVSVPLQPSQDDDEDDANVFYIPPCTELMRCSGCCDYQPHTCIADRIETVQRSVINVHCCTDISTNSSLLYELLIWAFFQSVPS